MCACYECVPLSLLNTAQKKVHIAKLPGPFVGTLNQKKNTKQTLRSICSFTTSKYKMAHFRMAQGMVMKRENLLPTFTCFISLQNGCNTLSI